MDTGATIISVSKDTGTVLAAAPVAAAAAPKGRLAIEGSEARVGEGYDPFVPAREMLARAGGDAPTEADMLYARRGEGSAARVAYANYVAVAGDGYAMGDGVIPVGCAHLEGAEQITLDGVLHSINEAGTTLPTDRWYGSEAVIDRWLGPALETMGFAEVV